MTPVHVRFPAFFICFLSKISGFSLSHFYSPNGLLKGEHDWVLVKVDFMKKRKGNVLLEGDRQIFFRSIHYEAT